LGKPGFNKKRCWRSS